MSLAGHTVLYGGSFNPPHVSHQMACLYLLEARRADAVWVLPAFAHPFGKPLAPFDDRLAMCRLLAEPFGARVVVSDVERQVGDGRTYVTLTRLIADHPGRRFALAVGADILGEAQKWHRWADIERLVRLEIIGRQGYDSAGRAVIDLPALSSTELRARVQRRESLEGLVPAGVADYIARAGLYL